MKNWLCEYKPGDKSAAERLISQNEGYLTGLGAGVHTMV